jgi:two-component system response regulator AtoC
MTAQSDFKTQLTQASLVRKPVASAPLESMDAPPPSTALTMEQTLRDAERQALDRALRHAGGNRTVAARILGVSRATVYTKMQEYGLK